jgi:hypothetical protein
MSPLRILIVVRGRTGAGKTSLLTFIKNEFQFYEIEIDRIKIRNHGSVFRCVPQVDFKEAGIEAKRVLNDGANVVVEEAFLSLEHLGFFMAGAQEAASKVIVIRLECSLETALARKKGVLPPKMVEIQYGRPVESVDGENIVNTELPMDTVFEQVRTLIL